MSAAGPAPARSPRRSRSSRLVAYRADHSRRSLAAFFRYGWHVLEPTTLLTWNWHLDAVAAHVQAALDDWREHQRDPERPQRIRDLVINIPPGTGKSRLVSVFAPAWMWLRSPAWRVLCLSANPRVALRDSMYCRDLLESEWYQTWFEPQWRLAPDQNAKSLYYNSASGYRSAAGITARITGERADCILVDDPHDAEEVHSKAQRCEVTTRWDAAIGNRVNDLRSSTRIGIMQRLHEEDWSGHVLAQGGWEHLCLPMEFDPARARTTAIGWRDPRQALGEVLHPERFPPEVLAAERVRLGSYGYAGQMQQQPAPAGGGLFRRAWWRFWKPDGVRSADVMPRPTGCWDGPARALPKLSEVVISLDAAFKGNADNDRVSFTVWGWQGADRYLLANLTDTLSFTQTLARLRQLAHDWPKAHRKLIEDKANGPAIIDMLRGEIPGLLPVDPEGGKETRAWAVQPQVESGNVFLPDGAPWLDAFLGECDAFPRGAHDDQVDSMTQALRHLSNSAMQRLIALSTM